MNEIFKMVLSLSFSGLVLSIILFLCKPFYKGKVSKCWQYYIWLIIIARLLLPFTPEISPVGTLFQEADNAIVQLTTADMPDTKVPPATAPAHREEDISEQNNNVGGEITEPLHQILPAILQNLWIIWLGGALLLLLRKITIYQGFVRYIRAGCTEVSSIELLDKLANAEERMRIKRPVELYANSLIASPLLFGFFHPCIVLPTTEISDADFQYTLAHELIHYKRWDMFYKWLVQICVCIHWFNPFVYLMSGDINRLCELSCDEAVIKKLGQMERRAYGDTLLNAIKTGGSYKDSLSSVTLSESKKLLKERLESIMKYRKTSKMAVAIALAVTLALAACATTIGAYTDMQLPGSNGSSNYSTSSQGESPSNRASVVSAKKDLKADKVKSISLTSKSCGIKLVKSKANRFTFDYLGVSNPVKFKVSCAVKNGVLKISVDGTAARDATSHFYINDGPKNYANVVRIGVPDKTYGKIAMSLNEAPISMPDFNAKIQIQSDDGSVSISDAMISNGNYAITNSSGSVSVKGNLIKSNISIKSEGECELIFNKTPKNLQLNLSACSGEVVLPTGWTKTQKLCNGKPIIKIANHGYTEVKVKG